MKIINGEFPPIYSDVIAAFPEVANMKYAIFTFGSFIYNPAGGDLPYYIVEHEEVHEAQQRKEGPYVWWKRYIKDPEYRLAMELPAYRAEYKAFCRENKDRNERDSFLRYQALMLSSPMYGNLMSTVDARAKIRQS